MENYLIILDRDGIINKLLVDSSGKIDSPMSIDQIEIFPWVKKSLDRLSNMKYEKVIATNQPAAAKGKISYKNLLKINTEIEYLIDYKVLCSFICFHRAEDICNCRKPKTGLLSKAFSAFPNFVIQHSWMVGDRATDVIAGYNFGIQTALLNYSKEDLDLLKNLNIKPNYIGNDLRDFVDMLELNYK